MLVEFVAKRVNASKNLSAELINKKFSTQIIIIDKENKKVLSDKTFTPFESALNLMNYVNVYCID